MDLTELITKEASQFKNISKYHNDFDKFVEKVIKGDDGSDFEQEELHRSWTRHLNICRRHDKYCALLAPFRHGKTVRLIVGYALHEIGKDPNIRMKLISATDKTAVDRVTSIKNYIENSPEYKEIFPAIVPDIQDWSKTKLTVRRTSKSVDSSLEAKGVFTGGTGSGARIILLDDVVTYENAIEKPGFRDTVLNKLDNVWLQRLDPDSFVLSVCTAWHEDDATHVKMRDTKWCYLIQRVSEDFNCIECEIINSPDPNYTNFSVPLSKRWPAAKLIEKYQSNARAFDRGYRQKAWSDDEKIFPSFPSCINPDASKLSVYRPELNVSIGVDLSGSKRPGTAIVVLGVDGLGQRYVLDVVHGSFTAPETLKQILLLDKQYNPTEIKVESNAYQQSLIEWVGELKESYPFWTKVSGFTTGVNKSNLEIGLPGLEVEFKNKAWTIPGAEFKDHDTTCKCSFCLFVKEFKDYPMVKTTDVVMATWFAWSSLRELFHTSTYEASSQGGGIAENFDDDIVSLNSNDSFQNELGDW